MGSVSIATVAWVPAKRTWLRVRVGQLAEQAAVGLSSQIVLGGGLGLGAGEEGGRDGVAPRGHQQFSVLRRRRARQHNCTPAAPACDILVMG